MANWGRTRKLYRSEKGMLFGVCQGIAEWKGIEVGYIRLALVILTVFTGFFPFGLLYILAALLMSVKPAYKEDYYSRSSVKRGYYDLKKEFSDLGEKINNLRNKKDCREKDWENRFYNERR